MQYLEKPQNNHSDEFADATELPLPVKVASATSHDHTFAFPFPVRFLKHRLRLDLTNPAYHVEMSSVFDALFRGVYSQSEQLHNVQMTQRRWRARLAVLVRSGWRPSAASKIPLPEQTRVAGSCRPCGCISQPRSLVCRLYFCPFCWGRRVSEAWQNVNDRLFADQVLAGAVPVARKGKVFAPKPPRRAKCSYDVMLLERIYKVPAQLDDDRGGGPGLPWFLDQRNMVRPRGGWPAAPACARGRDIATFNCLGFFEAIVPLWQRTEPSGWRIRVRQLCVIPVGEPLGYQPQEDVEYSYRRLERPTRAQIRKAMAWVCRYPPWFLQGPPEALLRFEQERGRRRFWTTTGILRQEVGEVQ